jgi:hypothetical protein
MERIGDVRFGPTITFLVKSTRMKAGAPTSSGIPASHVSPKWHSIASTGAQINGLEPSKSPAIAVEPKAQTNAANGTRSIFSMFSILT